MKEIFKLSFNFRAIIRGLKYRANHQKRQSKT